MGDIISRFAPAPTGRLHLGHVVNAIYVWGVTRARHGAVLLRIEDHDRQRSSPEFEAEIVRDLEWLGFVADAPAVRQSDRGDIYQDALARLRRAGLVYACACSRSDLARSHADAPQAGRRESDELRYPGTCRDRGLAEAPGLGLRVRLVPAIERFVDLRHGPLAQQPSAQCGDLLLRDREGNWTYQFAAAVDDFVQGVTLVIRGDDLLASTGRQIQLARLLGRATPPEFLHHPLVMKSPSQKLSKSDRDSGVADLREQGWTPARVIAEAAARAGLVTETREIDARDVANLFR